MFLEPAFEAGTAAFFIQGENYRNKDGFNTLSLNLYENYLLFIVSVSAPVFFRQWLTFSRALLGGTLHSEVVNGCCSEEPSVSNKDAKKGVSE